MKLDIEFEENVLARTLRDSVFLNKASRILETHHFATKYHSWIWKNIKETWINYKELCSPKAFLFKLNNENLNSSEEKVQYINLIKKLFKTPPTKSGSSLEILTDFVRLNNAQTALEKSVEFLTKGKIDSAYEILNQVVKKDLKPQNYTHIEWLEEFEQRQNERKYRRDHPEEFTVIPTGIKKLDSIISGIQPGELALCIGTTGRGKSIMLSNLAYNAVRLGFETAYFAFEMPARQIAQRADSRWLGIQYNKFKNYDFKPSELEEIDARLKKMKDLWKGLFQIFSMPVRTATINTVRSALEDIHIKNGFSPKLVIFDSGDHLLPTGKSESFRLDQANVYWSLKSLAEDLGISVWSSTQAKQEFAKKTATSESGAESYDKARIADIIISLNDLERKSRSTKIPGNDFDEEPEIVKPIGSNVLELYLAKYRDGASRIRIPLETRLEKMLISDLSDNEEQNF
jgi:replicative DNA helicase